MQPKKETVRINLPPKPSAAPTIKLPTLPPGGPTGAGGVPMAPAPSAAAHAAAPAAAPRTATAAPVAQRQPAAAPQTQTQQKRTAAPAAGTATVSGLDKILALVAAVAGIVAILSTAWLAFMLLDK